MQRTMASKLSFCVIQVSIRNRGQIERQRGPGFAEQAVRTFSAAVQQLLPPGSVTGTWDGTELCAIVLVGYHDAVQLTREFGMVLERSEVKAGSAALKARLTTVPFNAEEGQDKLGSKAQRLMAG